MDDTKYFEQAVTEYCLKRSMHIQVGHSSTMGELSQLLRRAQELKDADKAKPELPKRLPSASMTENWT